MGGALFSRAMAAPSLAILAQATEHTAKPLQGLRQIFLDSMGYQEGAALGMIAALFAAGLAIQILAGWIAAKAVIGNELCTLANTVKLWLVSLIVSIGVGLAMGLILSMVVWTQNNLAALVVVAGGGLLMIALAFLLPMKIFDTNFLRAFGFIIVSFILIVAANVGLDHAMGLPMFGRGEELAMHFKRVTNPGISPIDLELDRLEHPSQRKLPLDVRGKRIKRLYEMLDARQKQLPPGDRTALAEYDRQRNRYEALLQSLKADAAPPVESAAAP